MKSKIEHIKFWIEQAQDDWEAVITLYEGKKFLQSLFFTHLVIEKLCKAIWVKNNITNIPPKIHNLNFIISEAKVIITDEIKEFMLLLNRFQLEGRYPEYINDLYKISNKDFTTEIIKKASELKKWLLDKLQ